MDITGLFIFDTSPLELMLRGTVMYWFIYLLFRFVLRRDVGSVGIADILLLVLIADASQNAMAGSYTTIAEGCVLVATLAGWNYLFDWATWRFDFVRRFAEPPPLLLVRHGRLLRDNLRREMLSVSELQSKLREQGIDNFGAVKAAFMEPNGEISVIREDGGEPQPPRRKPVG